MADSERSGDIQDDDLIIHQVTIRNVLDANGINCVNVQFAPEGIDEPPLMTVLGMLDLARDTAYRYYMGEVED